MRPLGFPPALRIRRKADFDAAFKDGAACSDAHLVVHARPNGLPHPRLGLAVGKAVGNSVQRNRVKRLLREAFRLHRASLPTGHDLVVVPRGGDAAPSTLEECARSLAALAGRAAERCARGEGGRRGRGKREEPRP